MRVVTVGDNCMDVYQTSGEAYPGGNPVNVSVYLKNLGAETAYVGWVGSDQYGDTMIQAIQSKGVDPSRITIKEGKTAVTFVELVDNDRRFGDYDEGVMASFSLTKEDLDFIQTFDSVHAGIWGHTEEYYPIFKEKGMLTFFDFSDQLNHSLVKTLPAFVDYPFFSYTKDDAYIRSFLKEVHALGSKVAVATLGENGSLAYDGEQFFTCGVLETNVVDTMGAGDSFIAGFIFGTHKGCSIQECLKLGSETAAKTIRYFGAW
ncbi:fructoselysine kinase [Heyndrickxia shackletonii]|uniref:Fructoselysine kinase n=1 Tax=Heyndrickxia shackletonii TaxID=157838 RepID=A0A0Q3WVA5_9BACI|nr:fructoselysine 6-kinase [Heyndrickxia shackletonii]KQL52821.1 fructoselysine kinase [Heyndrickxia shackletonii]MBB2482306.1 fructoselysine 6-kinase [Bacillus sp. APMAM]NEZ02492.1 fructoselysine 6-kinase [Heyndrickxia shackletonii]RTZ54347.1 fructoselysine 6-kinase [Bacillus sp. SAJ1]